jgi:hypothetical protein
MGQGMPSALTSQKIGCVAVFLFSTTMSMYDCNIFMKLKVVFSKGMAFVTVSTASPIFYI